MKAVYYQRNLPPEDVSRYVNKAEIIYFSSLNIAGCRLKAGPLPGQYKLNTNPEILEEGRRISRGEESSNRQAAISGVRHLNIDETIANQFIEYLRAQETLQTKIEEAVAKILGE